MILERSVSFEGPGLHLGRFSSLDVLPAPPGTGAIVRLGGRDASLSELEPDGSGRSTRLVDPLTGASIASVEHVLAALAGIDLWDAILVLRGEEVPVLDGSALPFAVALAGACSPSPAAPPVSPARAVRVDREGAWVEATPSEGLVLDVGIEFPHPCIGRQRFVWESRREGFVADLAPARTFGFVEELPDLRTRGLAAGGCLSSVLAFGPSGILNPGGARFPDEPARHKALDLMGDLALLGRPLQARVVAERPSHALNHDLVRALRDVCGGVSPGRRRCRTS